MDPDAGLGLLGAAEPCRYGFHPGNLGRSGARTADRRLHGEKCPDAGQENRRSVETAIGRKKSRGPESLSMTLPLNKKYAPMEALPAAELPEGPEWQYEPKWDGFRCLAFRDGEQIDLQSKSGKPLTRYFPELAGTLLALKAKKFVLDGEIVIPVDGNLSFDELLMRIHPAASRVLKLSREHPSVFIVFDLLVDEKGKSLVKLPLKKRRQQLERFAKLSFDKNAALSLSPVTDDLSVARKWFHMGVGLDGIGAKRKDLPYQTGERTGMQKIKKQRTADCVVGGFRYLEKKPLVGSLLLGLYNTAGLLDHVGFCSAIHAEDRAPLTRKL